MGFVREETCLTGINEDRTYSNYGREDFSDVGEEILREFDVKILKKIVLENKNVFEFGFGRGESIKYCLERNCSSYIGVDFSPNALKLAKEYLKKNNIIPPPLYCEDALEFMQKHNEKIRNKIDVVIMFDFIEHVPRHELRQLISVLKEHLSEKPVIVINTPIYAFDTDISSEVDVENRKVSTDQTDSIEETKSRHCNKFTVVSLQKFMADCDLKALTQSHIFIPSCKDSVFSPKASYAQAWNAAYTSGFPIQEEYLDDELEYAVTSEDKYVWHEEKEGLYSGIKVYMQRSSMHIEQNVLEKIYESEILKGQTVFDIGAYTGVSSLLFSQLVGPTGRVLSFEPNPWNIDRCRLNFSHNPDLAKQIHLYELGFSSSSGVMPMLVSCHIDNGHSSTSQLKGCGGTIISHKELYELGFQDINITVETLDSFAERTGVIPDVIKIDIEGAESECLVGGLKTLELYKPSLFIETHNPKALFSTLQTLSYLKYKVHMINHEWGERLQIFAKSESESCDKIPSFYGVEGLLLRDKMDLLHHEVSDLKTSFAATQEKINNIEINIQKIGIVLKKLEKHSDREITLTNIIKYFRFKYDFAKLKLKLFSQEKLSPSRVTKENLYSNHVKKIFNDIYNKNYWGNEESRSGNGSDLSQTEVIRRELPALVREFKIKSILDLPCGDFHWMKTLKIDADYIGADIVPGMIDKNKMLYETEKCRFMTLDLIKDTPPEVDLIFCRDLMVHLSIQDVKSALKNMMNSGSKYLLATTFTNREINLDIPTGHWRPLNLEIKPFNFPEPLKLINEHCTEDGGNWQDKSLGLWLIKDISRQIS